jgi:hypothetical protein
MSEDDMWLTRLRNNAMERDFTLNGEAVYKLNPVGPIACNAAAS